MCSVFFLFLYSHILSPLCIWQRAAYRVLRWWKQNRTCQLRLVFLKVEKDKDMLDAFVVCLFSMFGVHAYELFLPSCVRFFLLFFPSISLYHLCFLSSSFLLNSSIATALRPCVLLFCVSSFHCNTFHIYFRWFSYTNGCCTCVSFEEFLVYTHAHTHASASSFFVCLCLCSFLLFSFAIL